MNLHEENEAAELVTMVSGWWVSWRRRGRREGTCSVRAWGASRSRERRAFSAASWRGARESDRDARRRGSSWSSREREREEQES